MSLEYEPSPEPQVGVCCFDKTGTLISDHQQKHQNSFQSDLPFADVPKHRVCITKHSLTTQVYEP